MDQFLTAMSRRSPNFAEDPGPDPRNDCPTCHGEGEIRIQTINGWQVELDRFEYLTVDSKGFACVDCYPNQTQTDAT